MFEDALVESRGTIRTHRGWFSGLAAICNGSILSVLLLWPLLHPASLPRQALNMLLAAPTPPAAPLPRTPRIENIATHATTLVNPFAAPVRIPKHIVEDGPAVLGNDLSDPLAQRGAGWPDGLAESLGTAATPHVRAAHPPKLAISSGVMAGNKLNGAEPQYSAITRAARIEGTVVLRATISKSGTIENLRVISGPPLLTPAAEQAVRTWRYRPYLLNGEPVEVETTVNIIFSLGR